MNKSPWILLIILFCACSKEEVAPLSETEDAQQYLFEAMDTWYLWKDEFSAGINPLDYASPQALLDDLRNSELDRWSNISSRTVYEQFYNNAQFYGFGFGWLTTNDDIVVSFVYDGSPFWRAGVRRGWKFRSIAGQPVNANSQIGELLGPNELGYTLDIELEDLEGNLVELNLSKEVVTINTVLHHEVVDLETETVGYLVFKNFLETSYIELDVAFQTFEAAGINRLILDLRYNTGGRLQVANHLASLIAPAHANGSVFMRMRFNPQQSPNNMNLTIDKRNALDVSELIVLTGENTASASEILINGLEPMMKVTQIGTGNTHGKPVGSYTFFRGDYAFTLISFQTTNSRGNGDFFNGLTPDFYSCDDLSSDFGGTEQMFNAALDYIRTGSIETCTNRSARGRTASSEEQPWEIMSEF